MSSPSPVGARRAFPISTLVHRACVWCWSNGDAGLPPGHLWFGTDRIKGEARCQPGQWPGIDRVAGHEHVLLVAPDQSFPGGEETRATAVLLVGLVELEPGPCMADLQELVRDVGEGLLS